LISLDGDLGAKPEILQLSREKKAEKLLGLLDPPLKKRSTIWTWAPPNLSGKPGDIAEAIRKAISPGLFQITPREWLAYHNGNEVVAIQTLLLGFWCISAHIKQLDSEKYKRVEKVSLHNSYRG
jgi:hypothetical protein